MPSVLVTFLCPATAPYLVLEPLLVAKQRIRKGPGGQGQGEGPGGTEKPRAQGGRDHKEDQEKRGGEGACRSDLFLLPLWLIFLISPCSALSPSLLLGRSILADSLPSDQPGNPALADFSEYVLLFCCLLLVVVGVVGTPFLYCSLCNMLQRL